MGYIYILTNPDYTDIKVGYAKNVQQRLATLNRSTSLRSPFELYATYEVEHYSVFRTTCDWGSVSQAWGLSGDWTVA